MKIKSSNTGAIFDFIPLGKSVEERYICPECSHTRKKSKDKCLAWDNTSNRGYCHNCGSAFFEDKPVREKKYFIPEWQNKTELTDEAVKWFTSRMISQDTLVKMKIYSDVEYMPQYQKEVKVICFPYFRDGKLVNIKYRGPQKSFKVIKDAELIWYNYDSLKDAESVFICEGEIDLLTFIENGFNNIISLPQGAGNMDCLDSTIGLFDNIKKVFIATDVDTKGIEARDELIRRIGPEKCFIVDLEGCKDANEYFCKFGGIKFKDIQARLAPVKGVIHVEDLYNDIQNFIKNGLPKGFETGVYEIDQYVQWYPGQLAIVTGVPSSGKSEFIDFLTVRLNLMHGWRTAYFTPENYPLIYHVNKIYEKLSGGSIRKAGSEIEDVIDYINDNFFYILDEEDLTVKKILDAAKLLVKTKGIKVLVIDPYNTIDHQYDKGTTETKYISEFLKQLSIFAKFNNVLVFLIAHPTKLQNGEIPSLYSISGSAHFYNKADYGIVVQREVNDENIMTGDVNIYWKKIRFRNFGKQGISKLIYNYNNGRYEQYTNNRTDVLQWDNSNWLYRSGELPTQSSEATPF